VKDFRDCCLDGLNRGRTMFARHLVQRERPPSVSAACGLHISRTTPLRCRRALVAQWIERSSPKASQVRFLPRAFRQHLAKVVGTGHAPPGVPPACFA
jgi:hypothetical protein